jgi:hypothetical protein
LYYFYSFFVLMNDDFLGTNDFARYFFSARYTILSDIRVGRVSFFQLGTESYNYVKGAYDSTQGVTMSWGDVAGMLYSGPQVPFGSVDFAYSVAGQNATSLPWWFALTGGISSDHAGIVVLHIRRFELSSPIFCSGRPRASRSLIVRRYNSRLGGETIGMPSFSNMLRPGQFIRGILDLTPPANFSGQLLAGDFVEFDVEVTLPPQYSIFFSFL